MIKINLRKKIPILAVFINIILFILANFSSANKLEEIVKTRNYKEYENWAKELKNKQDQRLNFNQDTKEQTNDFNNINIDSLLNKYTPNWKSFNTNKALIKKTKSTDVNRVAPLVFISFSMPEKLINEYIAEAKLYDGILVLKGLINNSFKETIKKLHKIGNKDKLSIIIHPHLFKLYDITKVPTIVVSKNNIRCIAKYDECDDSYEYDKISGSITIQYALEKIRDKGSKDIRKLADNILNN